MAPIVRVIEASLGPAAQVRLVVTGVSDPDGLRSAWASSGAAVERAGTRLRATSTVVALERAAGRRLPADEAGQLGRAARSAVSAWTSPPPPWELAGGPVDLSTPLLMGVLNVTPDSFSDGGVLYPAEHPDAAVDHGRRGIAEGAAIVDVGGESTRPGAEPVGLDEELRRVLPVVRTLAGEAIVSIDTTKAEVARQAVEAGAQIVNDVSGGDPELLDVVAETGAGYVLMHRRGTPTDMQRRTQYEDVVAEVYEFLAEGLERCARAGVPAEHVTVDPGIGFAKTGEQSVDLLRATPQFRSLGRPVVIGASRKSFLGSLLGAEGNAANQRLEGSLAASAAVVLGGASIIRVHDVAENARVVRVAAALRRHPLGAPDDQYAHGHV